MVSLSEPSLESPYKRRKVRSKRYAHGTSLYDIKPALSCFIFTNKTLRHAHCFRQLVLRELFIDSEFSENLPESCIL